MRNLSVATVVSMAMVLLIAGGAQASLIGYWSLDGDANADFGGWGASTQNAGANTENDVSFPNDVPALISSRNTQSIAFDGNNDDWVVTGFNAQTAGVSGAPTATISFWVKENTSNNKAVVFLGNSSQTGGQVVSLEPAGTNNLSAFYFNGNAVTGNNDLPNNSGWHHVAWTYNGTTHGNSRVYIDGVDQTATWGNPGNTLNIPNDAAVSLGARVNGSAPVVTSQIADLAIWDEVLDLQTIEGLAAGNPVPEPATLALAAMGLLGLRRHRRRA